MFKQPVDEDAKETTFAQGRLPERTYASKSFPLKRTNSDDDGTPARFVCKVFDPDSETIIERDGEEWLVRETPAGRYQFKLLVCREAGNVKELWIQRVPGDGETGNVQNLFNLKQPEVTNLVQFFKILETIPIEGATSVRVDDNLVRDIFEDRQALSKIYETDPGRFRQLIESDVSARDVIAMASRKEAVCKFERLLEDDDYFDAEVSGIGKGSAERVWQLFFESNPWILGVSFPTQLVTAWNNDRLEQIVSGFDIAGPGKRVDGLMRTSGVIRSMVFLEFKTHRTELLDKEYRTGCWTPSRELSGGVAQIHGTVHRAIESIGNRINSVDTDGSEIPNDLTYLLRPKSLLIAGKLNEFTGAAGGHNVDKIRSFELYRRSVFEPDIATFDEILARAKFVANGE